MPRSRFSTLIKKFAVQNEPLSFPIRYGPKELNKIIKKLLKDNDVETIDINFNFFVNGLILKEPLNEFVEHNNMSDEIEEITYDIEMQPPILAGEVKLQNTVTCMKFQSNYLLTASYDVQIFDVTNLEKPLIFIEMEQMMFAVDWLSFDEKTLEAVIIIGGEFGKISLWHCNMRECIANEICKFEGTKQFVTCFSVSKELNLVACGTWDGWVCIWSTDLSDIDQNSNGFKIRQPHTVEFAHDYRVNQIQWLSTPIVPIATSIHHGATCHEGNLLTCSTDFMLKLWNLSGNVSSLVREENTTNPVKAIAVNNSTGVIVLGSANNRLKVYNLQEQTAQVHNIFKAHQNSIIGVKFSAVDANIFVTAGVRGELKLWDIRNVSTPLMLISKFDEAIHCCDWDETGHWLASAYADNSLRVHKFQ